MAMELTGKAVVSALIVWLLLVHPCLQVPSALGADDCWVLDRDRYYYCLRTHKCRNACQKDRFADGRCNHAFPYLVPLCECLRPECAAQAAGGHAESGSIP